MDIVLTGLNCEICLAYLDDIILYSGDLATHLERLERLLSRFRKACLKPKPSKCHLLQKQVRFLGFTVSQEGIGTDAEKVAAIRSWPTPQNLRQTERSLVCVNTIDVLSRISQKSQRHCTR